MRTLFIALLFVSVGNLFGQQTQVDSAQARIERYYNPDLTDSLRVVYKNQILHMNKYIAQDSLNPKAYLQRGIYYSQLGLAVEAIADYDKTLKLDNKEPIAYFNRGLAKSRFKFTYEGCYDFKMAAKLGIEQANEVYNDNCQLFKASINTQLANH